MSKERLVELIGQAKSVEASGIDFKVTDEYIADYLLANGVVVPKVKVCDSIFRVGGYPEKRVYEWQVSHFTVYGEDLVYFDDSDNEFWEEDIGKTVFLTREEAEAKLKEKENET
jgi:hypothetical protein